MFAGSKWIIRAPDRFFGSESIVRQKLLKLNRWIEQRRGFSADGKSANRPAGGNRTGVKRIVFLREGGVMGRITGKLLVTCLVFTAALATSATRANAGPGDEKGFQVASQAFAAALAKHDATAVGKLLDLKFQWIDRNG